MQKEALILYETGKPFAKTAYDTAVGILAQAGIHVQAIEEMDAAADTALKKAHYLIVRSNKITKEHIDAAPALELIVRAGAGYDTIDVDYATSKNIYVMNTPGQNATAVAELVFNMIHHIVRPLNGKSGTELRDKKLGILGFGNIGKQVAMIAKGYGMEVRVFDVFETLDTALRYGVAFADSALDVFTDMDFVSLHVPSTRETRNFVGRACLEKMKPNGVVINTARADVVNHAELATWIEGHPGFRYLSDVDQKTEALRPLVDQGRVVIPPKKMGAQTAEANFNAARAAAQQIVDFHYKGVTRFAVNNPVPADLQLYTDLATYLGRFSAAFVPTPKTVQCSCYGGLHAYRETFIRYVLKGLFQQSGHGRAMTPVEAKSLADEHGILLEERTPDDRKGYGLAMTVDFLAGDTRVSIRGAMEESEPQISRLDHFKTRIPLRDSVYVIVQTKDRPGVEYEIAQNIVNAGYNRSDLGYSTVSSLEQGMAFYIVDKKGASHAAQIAELNALVTDIRARAPVIAATVVDLTDEE